VAELVEATIKSKEGFSQRAQISEEDFTQRAQRIAVGRGGFPQITQLYTDFFSQMPQIGTDYISGHTGG
jgi:hypothetical protein